MPADNNSKGAKATCESGIEITVHEETRNNDPNKEYIISNDADMLHKFVQTTLELRELVKCPLCLDVMDKPVEVSCSHCFCGGCLDTFFEEYDKPFCPVCRILISKRSRQPNKTLLGYINFVNDVNKELQKSFDCEVTDLNKRTKINEKLGLPNSSTPSKRAISASPISDVIPGTVQTPKKRGRPPKNKPHASADDQQLSNRKPKIQRIETRSVSQQKITKKNNGNTDSIIHWLTDNKNKFDRVTQTQQSVSSKCSQESFDLPSVSQLKNKKHPRTVKTRPRSTSLCVENEQIYQEPRVRHNSWPAGNGKLNNFLTNEECLMLFLEETRKAAELRQKEEEFLESIENEVEMQKKIEEPKQKSKKRKRKSGTHKSVDTKLLLPPESKNALVHHESCDVGVVEALFNKNLSKITNNVETTVVVLEQNTSKKTTPKVLNQVSKGNKKPAERTPVVVLEKMDLVETALNNLNDDDYIFLLPTQKNPPQQTDTENVFIELQRCIEKIQLLSSDNTVTENCRLLKQYATNIEEILKGKKRPENLKTNTTDAVTQTDLKMADAAIQTDENQNAHFTPSTVLSEPFNGSLISKLVQKYGKEQPANEKISQHSNSFDQITFNTQDLQLQNSPKQSDEAAYKISNTLDNIDFDTQQLVQKHNKLLSNSSPQIVLNVDAKRNSVSRKLDYSENQGESQRKRFKRIRAPTDSDSDTDVQESKRNKYLQEDISVRFESEVPVASRNTPEEEFKLSDDASYSVFVDKILEKYDKPPVSTQFEKTKTNKQLEKTKNKPIDVIERCERIIKQADKNTVTAQIHQNVDENRNPNSCKSQKQKHVFSSDETFNDEEVMQAIDRDIEEIQKVNRSFSQSQILSKQPVDTKNVQNDDIIELDDSFDEEIALLDPENDHVTVVENNRNRINILQDIAVKPIIVEEMRTSDEEIFSDNDVVEGTPPRNESQFNDIILPPPPEFQVEINSKNTTTLTAAQEFNTEQDMIDKTLTEHMKIGSATPEFFSPPPPRAQPLSLRINAMGTSTPISGKAHSERSLTFSPIAVQRNKNPFEAAKNIKESPLTVVANTPQPTVIDRKIVDNTPKQQQSILNYVKPVTPCITCSRLENEHMIAVSTLASTKLAVYTSTFGPNVTHVVVAVNEKNCVKDHTMKYVCGVAAGIWVVSGKWVQKCLAQKKIVPEEPFEVKDVSGMAGPRQSRLTRTRNPLLRGFKIYAAPPFLSTTAADVENVVKMLGGTVVSKPDALANKQGHICVIISEASATQDFEIYEYWLETFKVITVDIEWLSRSVGQYKIVSLKPFALCSEDLLDNLGYPDEMIRSMQSFASEYN